MNKSLETFLVFLKIGITTFGGGYAMISNVKEEVIDKRGWITNEELLDVIAIAESTPGPVAINLATFVGFKRGKFLGSILATLGVIIPSILIILGITYLFNEFIDNPIVSNAFLGVKAAVALLIIKSGINLWKQTKLNWWQKFIFLLAFASATLIDLLSLNFSPIYLIFIFAFLGILVTSLSKIRKENK